MPKIYELSNTVDSHPMGYLKGVKICKKKKVFESGRWKAEIRLASFIGFLWFGKVFKRLSVLKIRTSRPNGTIHKRSNNYCYDNNFKKFYTS